MELQNNLSLSNYFYIGVALAAQYANIDDFKDGEIRCLYPENSPLLKEMEKWDGKLINEKNPIQGDLGINNKREIFHYRNGIWKSIKG